MRISGIKRASSGPPCCFGVARLVWSMHGSDDNPSDNAAISLQRAHPKEGEGNLRPVSLVQ